jgi:hypothetical protein
MLRTSWVGAEFDFGDLASFLDQLRKFACGHWRAALAHEQERRLAFGLTSNAPQRFVLNLQRG